MKMLIIPSVMVCSLFAGEQNFLEIGGGMTKGKDNFSTESSSKISNYSKAKSESEVIPNISFYFDKELSSNANIYISSEFGNIDIGSEIETDIGLFNIGVINDFFGDAWENPFLLNSSRKKTDVKEIGGYIGYGIPLSDNYFTTVTYQYSSVDFDKDTTVSDLQRDGKRKILIFENMLEYSNSLMFMGSLNIENYDANGEASSYKNRGLELVVVNQITDDIELTLMGGYSEKKYDKINPFLNKKIDSQNTSIFTSLKLSEPLDYKNTYISLNVGYEQEDANHNFYDKSNTYSLVNVGYNF